jgi:hypothetical protein
VAKGCNMRSKTTRRECRIAYKYIRNHKEQGCLIYEWNIDPKYLIFDDQNSTDKSAAWINKIK